MPWQGDPSLIKDLLAEVGADREKGAWRIGPDLPDIADMAPGDVLAPLPIVPVLADSLVIVNDNAEYYVGGEARSLTALLITATEGLPDGPITDVIVVEDLEAALNDMPPASIEVDLYADGSDGS